MRRQRISNDVDQEKPDEIIPGDVIVQMPQSPMVREYKVKNIHDAMRLAMENLAFEGLEESGDPDPYGYVQEIEESTGIDLLSPKWKSKPDDDRWNRRVKSRARKAAVARMYLMGYSVAEIANKVEVSESTVVNDINIVTQEWRDNYLEDIETLASRDLARLDDMFNKLATNIEQGNVGAIKTAVEIIRERGNILGYRQGVQVDIEQHVREIAASQGLDPDQAVQMAQRISIRYK